MMEEDKIVRLNLDLRDALHRTEQTLEEGILESAAEKLLQHFNLSNSAQAQREFGKIVERILNERLTELAEATVAEVLQMPHSWDLSRGRSITIAEAMQNRFRDFLEEKVDANGRANSSSYGTLPRVNWLVQKHVNVAWQKELEEPIKEAKKEVARLTRERAADIVTTHLGKDK